MEIIIPILVFVFGAAIGSFINAAVYRLYHRKPIAVDRSRCVHCASVLRALDLIPIVSFLLLRGRCRTCAKPIPPSYLAVELATAVLFMLAWIIRDPLGESVASSLALLILIRDWVAVSVFLFLFVYDLKYMLLPDEVTLPAIVVLGLLSFFIGTSWLFLVSGVVVGAGFFLLQYGLSRGRWIGGGDIRMGALMGALLGWPLVAVALLVSYVFGAVVSVGWLLSRRKRLGQAVPFGTFLAIGTLITLWWGQNMLDWYLQLL